MTLIITSLRRADIVITSDSRATLLAADGKFSGVVDSCQKIFPVPDHPIVISHHGENELGDKPLAQFLDGFAAHLNAGNLTIQEIADQFRTYAHPAVRARLRRLAAENHGVGFLFSGFGADDAGPTVVEVFWKVRDGALVSEERQWFPLSVISSGNGAAQIERADWRNIADTPLEKVRRYNEHLLEEALTAKVEHNTVGGPVQEIMVTREKWEWTIRPVEPAPAGAPATAPSSQPSTQPAADLRSI